MKNKIYISDQLSLEKRLRRLTILKKKFSVLNKIVEANIYDILSNSDTVNYILDEILRLSFKSYFLPLYTKELHNLRQDNFIYMKDYYEKILKYFQKIGLVKNLNKSRIGTLINIFY